MMSSWLISPGDLSVLSVVSLFTSFFVLSISNLYKKRQFNSKRPGEYNCRSRGDYPRKGGGQGDWRREERILLVQGREAQHQVHLARRGGTRRDHQL